MKNCKCGKKSVGVRIRDGKRKVCCMDCMFREFEDVGKKKVKVKSYGKMNERDYEIFMKALKISNKEMRRTK